MLNEQDVKSIFNKEYKTNRVITSQQRNNYCVSFVREKLILRYSLPEAILIVRDEIFHKICVDNPSLIDEALDELKEVKLNLLNSNYEFFLAKPLSAIIPHYMLLLQYVGLNSKKSKICCRIKNFIEISKSFSKGNLYSDKFDCERIIQIDALDRKLNFYTSCAAADVIIYMLRYDINKK